MKPKPMEAANAALAAGGILAGVSVFIAAIAPELPLILPNFTPAHQRILLAFGVLCATAGSILSQQIAHRETRNLRAEVKEDVAEAKDELRDEQG